MRHVLVETLSRNPVSDELLLRIQQKHEESLRHAIRWARDYPHANSVALLLAQKLYADVHPLDAHGCEAKVHWISDGVHEEVYAQV